VAHVAPKPDEIKARFPEFASVADARIALALIDAGVWVDTSWTEASYGPAMRYLTAHILLTEGALNDGAAAVDGVLVSESLGDATRTWRSRAEQLGISGLDAELAGTTYGQRFLAIRRGIHGGPRVV
jgi:hypothetical protein